LDIAAAAWVALVGNYGIVGATPRQIRPPRSRRSARRGGDGDAVVEAEEGPQPPEAPPRRHLAAAARHGLEPSPEEMGGKEHHMAT